MPAKEGAGIIGGPDSLTRVPLITPREYDDSMEVVRHHDKGVECDFQPDNLTPQPLFLNDSPVLIEQDSTRTDLAE